MPCPTKSMKQTWKQVRRRPFISTCLAFLRRIYIYRLLELDALQLEEEEEGPSYLADLNKVPDFIDEPPVEVGEVSKIHSIGYALLACLLTAAILYRHPSSQKPSSKRARSIFFQQLNVFVEYTVICTCKVVIIIKIPWDIGYQIFRT